MMCEKCLYRKNCQFLAKYKGVIATDCTAFNAEEELKANIKAEAVREILGEISKALENNYKRRSERMKRTDLYADDPYISYCNGKIDCLRGLKSFIEEMVGEQG